MPINPFQWTRNLDLIALLRSRGIAFAFSWTYEEVLAALASTGTALPTPTQSPRPDPIKDDFISWTGSAGLVGELDWKYKNGSVADLPTVEAAHPGILVRTTSITPNEVSSMYLGTSTSDPRCVVSEIDFSRYVVRAVSAATDHIVRVGFFNDTDALQPVDGIYLERLATDATWFAVCRNAGVENRTSTGAAYDTNWHRLVIKQSNGAFDFNLDAGGTTTIPANIPTIPLAPGIQVIPTTATPRDFLVDYFDLGQLVTR